MHEGRLKARWYILAQPDRQVIEAGDLARGVGLILASPAVDLASEKALGLTESRQVDTTPINLPYVRETIDDGFAEHAACLEVVIEGRWHGIAWCEAGDPRQQHERAADPRGICRRRDQPAVRNACPAQGCQQQDLTRKIV